MEPKLRQNIEEFLAIADPSDEKIKEAALWLLRISPKSRAIYNTAQRRPQAMLKWIRADLTKYVGVASRGLERSEVKAYNEKAVTQVRQTLAVRPVDVNAEKQGAVPEKSIRGKRADHDSLPENIKVLWEKNSERWKKLRQMHEQLLLMTSSKDYEPCDGNELCHVMLQTDADIRNDYKRYDTYKAGDAGTVADDVKAAGAARTAITRALSRKNNTEEQLEALQDAVNLLYKLGGTQKPATVEKLKALGISIPNV